MTAPAPPSSAPTQAPTTAKDDGPPDRWAIVLGASSGTGAAVARAVAHDPGLSLYGVHRGHWAAEAAAVEHDVRAAGRRVLWRVAEAGTADEAREGAAAIHEAIGPRKVRLLVHSIANASMGRLVSRGKDQLHPKQFAKTFESMANSFVYWTQELMARDLLCEGAQLIAFTNEFTHSVTEPFGLIAAAKAALEIYVRYLAHEIGPLGFRVNLIRFGLVETPAVKIAFSPEAWERVRGRVAGVTPAGRLQGVDEVARFVSVLARSDDLWFNGSTINLTGGQCQAMLDRLFYSP
ncbi:MAG: SDR family oxidoreductase [Myxococcales bacterium]|nr:SDR family oxidoreductase [Myxococcales bacterium]